MSTDGIAGNNVSIQKEETNINNIVNEINILKKNIKRNNTIVRNAANSCGDNIATYSSSSKMSDELNDGINRCFFNNVAKSLVYKYGSKPLKKCIQIETKGNDIKNIGSIIFINNNKLNGLINTYDEYINMNDDCESLNVAVASSIIMYEINKNLKGE